VLSEPAACLTAVVAAVAQMRNIPLRSVSAMVEAGNDIQGVLGMDPDVRNGFDGVRVTFNVDADAPREQIEPLVAQSQTGSAGLEVMTNPTNVTVTVA